MKHFARRTVLLIAAALLAASCATVSESGRAGSAGSGPMYYGSGAGDSAIEAMKNAYASIARKAAEDLLGEAAAAAKAEDLDRLFASIVDFSPYLFRESQQTLGSSVDGQYSYTIGVRINLDALGGMLESEFLMGGQVDGITSTGYRLPDMKRPASAVSPSVQDRPDQTVPAAASPEKASVKEASAAELEIIGRYLDGMTYMVYYSNDSGADPALLRTAVLSANRYLEQQGIAYVDLNQIEKIRKDQQLVYEEETGNAVSIIQWIAHKLNADIYIEISAETSSKAEGGKYYGSASVSLNCFEASTAEGRGAAVYQTNPPAFSTVSEQDALVNAVSSAVFKAMGNAVREARTESRRALASGFRYRLVMTNTSDSRAVRDFEKHMSDYVKDIRRVSYSPEETVFDVRLIGSMSELEDLVYEAAAGVPGMDGLYLVMQQRSAITFDTGM